VAYEADIDGPHQPGQRNLTISVLGRIPRRWATTPDKLLCRHPARADKAFAAESRLPRLTIALPDCAQEDVLS